MKMKTLMAVTAAAALIVSACSKENEPVDTAKESTVLVKVNEGVSNTRAEAGKVNDDDPISLGEGYLFFTESNGIIVRMVKIVSGTPAGDDETSLASLTGSGATIKDVLTSARKCYIFSKIPSGVSMAGIQQGATDITAVLEKAMNVNDLVASDGGIGDIPLWGEGDIVDNTANPMEVDVTVYAMGSRIQVEKLTGIVDIVSFDLKGIFINNYFEEMPVGYELDAADITNNKSDTDLYTSPSSAYDGFELSDWYATGLSSANKVVSLSGTDIWAYNIWPTEGLPTADQEGCMPHIIFVLNNVVYEDAGSPQPAVTTPLYLTVGGMKNSTDSSPVTVIKKGNSYTFKDIQFEFENLTTVPEVDSVNAEVTVTLTPWKDNEVEPEL